MATIRDEKDKVPLASTSCPGCKAIVVNGSDKFCRICGMRVLMACIKCQQSVRPSDKYCSHCGARRWALFEMWRHGILHRSPGFTLFTIGVVGVAWLAVYAWVKSRYRYSY